MRLCCRKKHAFVNFFNQLSVFKEDKSQMLLIAYGAWRWVPQKGSTPAPSTLAHEQCAQRFDTVPIDAFRKTYVHHELRCTLQKVGMETGQSIAQGIEKYEELKRIKRQRVLEFENSLHWRVRPAAGNVRSS